MSAKPPMVFSIRAEYCARILDGSKRWEFRTRRPRVETGELCYIYESRGRGRIVASFRRGRSIYATPVKLFESVRRRGGGHGIGVEPFLKYFGDRVTAYAIELLDVEPLDMPLPEGMRAPQSWARLKVSP